MAATDATYYPVKGQAFRATGVFTLVTTGKESSGALTALAASISKDGGAYASATNSPAQQGTTGIVTLDLTSTEMDANTVIVKFTSSLANTVDVIQIMRPVVLDETAGNVFAATVKRLEQFVIQSYGRFFNRRVANRNDGSFTQYAYDNTTSIVTGSVIQNSDSVDVSRLA